MKSSTFTGILLTLVMLLVVAAAAFFFLFVRQQELVDQRAALMTENDGLKQEVAESGMALTAAQSTREVVVAALATAEANEVRLGEELVASDGKITTLETENETLTGQLADATASLAELQIENETIKAQFPFVRVVSPVNNDLLPPDVPVDLLVMAYDPLGITAVNLTLDEETIDLDGGDEPFFVYRQSWEPVELGEHTISVMVVNTAGTAADPQIISFQMIDIAALNAQIRREIETAVIDLSGLVPLTAVEPTFLTREQLGTRVEADFSTAVSPEQAQQDVLTLSAFDFVSPDYDLYGALVDLYSQGVLGFYDAETAEFVVISDDEMLDFNEQLTHVHEFVHALQDQYYDLDQLDNPALDSEAAVALRALAEGHATLIEGFYLADSDISEVTRDELIAAAEIERQEMADFPVFLTNDISFPYTAGFEFVMALYRQGGMEAIEDAWENPPQSTEHILHPEQYWAGDEPQVVSLPSLTGALGEDWLLLDENTFGEFYLRQYLSQQLDENSVDVASTGWGGDRYAVYWNETDEMLVMVLRLAWDSVTDQAEFMAIYPQYPAYLFAANDDQLNGGLHCIAGPDDLICVGEVGADSLIIRAPDVATAVRIFEQFS